MKLEDKTVQQHIDLIRSYFHKSQYDYALDYCNTVLQQESPTGDELLKLKKLRAHIYSALHLYQEAFEEEKSMIDNYTPRVTNYYCAALYLINCYEFKEAVRYLDEGIILSCELNQSYYFSSLHILKALSHAKLGNKKLAQDAIQYFDDDRTWIWPDGYPTYKTEIEEMIANLQDE